ncbi:thiolase family protein [Prosthecobacter vanneervenii]|uniref:Acetyl-CoA C-acetyltransferase/acetyl-CoA acyltransferase n=1 Tax=Prosthecobacter vanneervenii TaxID=48466 RepID=A0A7W7YA85_9BACT|nr:thiolase family protein [Prosthecobacter vanneervenii]MBB5032262.1 acetyl-CoA C-acetyltransferase/acetyl-CoA acyltransferase [Prosthecobacter vanneervenii]
MKTPSLVIVDAVRTPFSRTGTDLAHLDAVELGRHAVSSLLTRTGIDPMLVDETIIGCVGQPPEAMNIARVIALRAGLPEAKPAMTVHRNCASGLEAITLAHAKMCAGQGEVFVVGGTESMSNMPFYFSRPAVEKFTALNRARDFTGRAKAALHFRPADFAPVIGLKVGLTDPVSSLNMGQTAEVLAREFAISREMQDAFAMRSHLCATRANHLLSQEIAPVLGKHVVEADNGIRSDSSLEKLAKLKPLFDTVTGSVTAGNSSQITDGAVALLVATEEAAAAHNWKPLGRLVSYAATGCDPARMGLGPVRALDVALHRSGWKLDDADVFEINEAFAAQVLAVMKCMADPVCARRAGLEAPLGEVDPAKINACGGAIALGHPVGATGARLVQTALNQLHANDAKRAVVSLCVGGGQGMAACLEAL